MNRVTAQAAPGANGASGTAGSDEGRLLRHKKELHQKLIASMDLSAIGTMSEEELRVEVRNAAEELCRYSSDLLSLSERERLVNEVLDETFGLGPLEPLMRDPTITDIMINGPKTVNRANNNGVPVILESPSAKVSRSLVNLAAGVNGRLP